MTPQEEPRQTISSGGVIVKVVNGLPSVLLLVTKDDGKAFLPKGHVEMGESLEEAALREIYEEAGLKKLKIIEHLGSNQRLANKAGITEHKTIHYFLMVPTGRENHCPQEDSSNIEFVWAPTNKLPEFYLDEQREVIIRNQAKISNLLRGH